MTGLRVRGISYTCGVHPPEVVEAVMRVIRDDLHGTSVMLIGTDHGSLVEAARGIVPGTHQFIRLALIMRAGRFLDRRITRRLDALLSDAAAVARDCFHGPVSYGAGYWDQVDWNRFDVVGVNLYRIGDDAEGYRRRVRQLVASADKPVVVTEFGCGAHVGGDRRGPGSFRIVRWFADPPRIREGNVRDENVQAAYLTELIDVYATEGVDGCFVFTFLMDDFPHREDPTFDLDMAGFGIVKVPADNPAGWRPKAAFEAVARSYRLIANG